MVEGRNWPERLVWSAVVVASVSYSAHLVTQSLREARTNPISTSVESVPVQDLPFPAVTIRPGVSEHYYRSNSQSELPKKDLVDHEHVEKLVR